MSNNIPTRRVSKVNREEYEALETLRASQKTFDAILFYISQPHLTERDRDELRGVLLILCRGEKINYLDKMGELV